MNIISQGGSRASTAMGQAGQMLQSATQSFNRGASMALKIDQVLEQEEAKLYNRQQQASEKLNNAIQQRINNNFKERQADLQERKFDTSREQWKKNYELNQEKFDTSKEHWEKDYGLKEEKFNALKEQRSFQDDLTVRTHNLTVKDTCEAVLADIDSFEKGTQFDDITIMTLKRAMKTICG